MRVRQEEVILKVLLLRKEHNTACSEAVCKTRGIGQGQNLSTAARSQLMGPDPNWYAELCRSQLGSSSLGSSLTLSISMNSQQVLMVLTQGLQ